MWVFTAVITYSLIHNNSIFVWISFSISMQCVDYTLAVSHSHTHTHTRTHLDLKLNIVSSDKYKEFVETMRQGMAKMKESERDLDDPFVSRYLRESIEAWAPLIPNRAPLAISTFHHICKHSQCAHWNLFVCTNTAKYQQKWKKMLVNVAVLIRDNVTCASLKYFHSFLTAFCVSVSISSAPHWFACAVIYLLSSVFTSPAFGMFCAMSTSVRASSCRCDHRNPIERAFQNL